MSRHRKPHGQARKYVLGGVVGAAASAVLVATLSASGASTGSPDETCSFVVQGGIVQPSLTCTPNVTTPPPTTEPSTSVAPPTATAPPSSVSPTPSPTPTQTQPAGDFPNASNTGVPAGMLLTPYLGSMKFASGTITGKSIVGDLTITGTVAITDSKVTGTITAKAGSHLTLTDDEIVGSDNDETNSVIFGPNITARRVNVHDGKANLQCQDGGCAVYDSYFHDPYFISPFHYDVIGSNGVNGMVLEHNSLQCKFSNGQGSGAGGCSADLGFFGDFAAIKNVTVNDNLFMASTDAGYCVITNAQKTGKSYPTGSNLVWTNNTFQKGSNGKCGYYGVVDEWQSGNGNVWSGNHWDDGTALSR